MANNQIKAIESITHPVDIHVGKRIRHRRWVNGMTQQQLAEQVGIKFQQIQKYETGKNRVSASRLWDIAQSLEVSVSFFFEGLEGNPRPLEVHGVAVDMLSEKETLQLLGNYYMLPEEQRRQLSGLIKILAKSD